MNKECTHKKALKESGITPPENYTCRVCEPSDIKNKVIIRDYCEYECDCPKCHKGDGLGQVRECVYCQLKWANCGEYNFENPANFCLELSNHEGKTLLIITADNL